MDDQQRQYDQRQHALREFGLAMNSLPSNKKASYLEAMEKCPHLVETETDPMQFIRYCDYNYWAAAERMCKFWDFRKDAFKDRAFLPLTMDGKGALNDDDILLLHAGFPTILPRSQDGRQVVLLDRHKMLPSTVRDNCRRACLYLAKLVAQDSDAQRPKGVIMLYSMVQPRLVPLDFAYFEKGIRNIRDAYPIHFEPHGLCILPKSFKGKVPGRNGTDKVPKQTYIADIISTFYGPHGASFRTDVHFETFPGDIFKILTGKLGLKKEGIPTCFGGTWSVNHARRWCQEQVGRERADLAKQRSIERLDLEAARPGEVTASRAVIHEDDDGSKNDKNKGKSGSSKQNKWTAERRRRVNALHSRKKRENRKRDLELMQNESQQLQKSHALLKAEHERLESALKAAKRFIAENAPEAARESCKGGFPCDSAIGVVPSAAAVASSCDMTMVQPIPLSFNGQQLAPGDMNRCSPGDEWQPIATAHFSNMAPNDLQAIPTTTSHDNDATLRSWLWSQLQS